MSTYRLSRGSKRVIKAQLLGWFADFCAALPARPDARPLSVRFFEFIQLGNLDREPPAPCYIADELWEQLGWPEFLGTAAPPALRLKVARAMRQTFDAHIAHQDQRLYGRGQRQTP